MEGTLEEFKMLFIIKHVCVKIYLKMRLKYDMVLPLTIEQNETNQTSNLSITKTSISTLVLFWNTRQQYTETQKYDINHSKWFSIMIYDMQNMYGAVDLWSSVQNRRFRACNG